MPRPSVRDSELEGALLRLRAVLIHLASSHGDKLNAAHAVIDELRARGIKSSLRTLYYWRGRYLRKGFAGLSRRGRSDAGCCRALTEEAINRAVGAATRIKRHGDLSREYRLIAPGVSLETFRKIVRNAQRHIGVIEMPKRKGRGGLHF